MHSLVPRSRVALVVAGLCLCAVAIGGVAAADVGPRVDSVAESPAHQPTVDEADPGAPDGAPAPAQPLSGVVIESVDHPEGIDPGDTIHVSVTVRNPGPAYVEDTVRVTRSHGNQVDERTVNVSMAANETAERTVSLPTHWRDEGPSTIDVETGADGLTRQVEHASGVYELWSVDAGGASQGSVANGTFYVGDGSALHAVDVDAAELQWSASVETDSPPAVANDTVVAAGDGLHAVNARTGRDRWVVDGTEFQTSPTVANGTVYAASASAIHAVDLDTGRELWRTDVESERTAGAVAVYDGTVYAVSEHDPAQNDTAQNDTAENDTAGNDSSETGTLRALDADTGAVEWNRTTAVDPTTPTAANGTVYVGVAAESGRDRVLALNASTGDDRWNASVSSSLTTGPTVADGVVLVGWERSLDAGLVGLDAVTGEERWEHDAGEYLRTAPTVANGTVYVGTGYYAQGRGDVGHWDLLDVKSGERRQTVDHDLARLETPILVDGTVYSSIDGDVTAYNTNHSATSGDSTVELGTAGQIGDRGTPGATPGFGIDAHQRPDETIAGSTYSVNVTVRNRAAHALADTVTANGSVGTCSRSTRVLDPGETATVTLECTAPADRGGEAATVDLQTSGDELRAGTVDVREGPGGERWSESLGGSKAVQGPAIAGDRLYVSDHRHVQSLDRENGSLHWDRYAPSVAGTIRSAPAVSNGTVYVGDDGGNVTAFASDTGDRVWSHDAGSAIVGSPTVAGNATYVGTVDGRLLALDADGGEPQWTTPTEGSVQVSPAVDDGTVYVGTTDGAVQAVDADDGDLLWNASTGDAVFSSPTAANGSVYLGTYDGQVHAFDVSDGDRQWNASTGDAVFSSPTAANGTVYVGSDDGDLYALEAANGDVRWNASTDDRVRSSPTVAGDAVYVGSDDGSVYALNVSDGSERWQFSADGVPSSPIVAEGTLYVGAERDLNGDVYAIQVAGNRTSDGSRASVDLERGGSDGDDSCRTFGSVTSCDLNGDGLHRDLTGDGNVTTADVRAFQSALFSDGVQEHPESFDFSESTDDGVSHGDVVALFQDVTGV